MAGASRRFGICGHCKGRFVQSGGPGRKREYCDKVCRSKAQRSRDGRHGQQQARSTLPLGRRIAEDLQALSTALLEAECDGRPLKDLLRCANDVMTEVESYKAAAVHDARNRGTSWDQVADAAHLSAATVRTRWSESKVRDRLQRRATNRAVVRQPPASVVDAPDAAEGSPPQLATERASAKLASALSHLHRSTSLTIREVAEETSLSASYVSRILSGERTPTWPVVCALAELFNGDPAELSALFEGAHGLVPPARHALTDAVARLQAALRGLHLAVGRPEPDTLDRASNEVLTGQTISDILEGVVIPGWEQTSALVTALGGSPADVRPLWEDVHYVFLLCLDPPEESPGPADPSVSD
ncbi:Helix-turn-helix domain-containing protein [Actinacidiphila glaucinigra]|uniref:Helix-turn-helix domain-containing protein n=1 Tax=Actinacidiphila glaucinigra TaxID=235986 RepID=A0A239NNQ7_9ACTN|nr:Helix-turn-helix domain-containing protein [Actinacidiphila glaucinigra]